MVIFQYRYLVVICAIDLSTDLSCPPFYCFLYLTFRLGSSQLSSRAAAQWTNLFIILRNIECAVMCLSRNLESVAGDNPFMLPYTNELVIH